MQRVTYEDKQGYLDENTKQFYPKESFQEVTYEGKKGIYHPESKQFFEVGASSMQEGQPDITPSPSGDFLNWIKGMASNVPESAWKNLIEPIIHPIRTVKSGAQLLKSIDANILHHVYGTLPESRKSDLEPAGAVWEQFVQTHWPPRNALKFIHDDPVAAGLEVSALFSGGGSLVSKVPGLAKTGATISKIGTAIDPLNVAKSATTLPLKTKLPEKLYGSAAKLPKTEKWSMKRRGAAIETGLKEAIMPTPKGYGKLWDKVNDLADNVESAIKQAGGQGEVVRGDTIVSFLDTLKNEYKNAPNPKQFLDTIDDFKAEFLAQKTTGAPWVIPIEEAQAMKQWVYRQFSKKYHSPIPPGLQSEMNMSIAKGAMSEIAKLHPEIDVLNKSESALLNLEEALRKAVPRIADRDIIGIGSPIKIATGMATGATIGKLSGLTAALLDVPRVKAALAITLGKARSISGRASQRTTLIRAGLIRGAGEVSELPEEIELKQKGILPSVGP